MKFGRKISNDLYSEWRPFYINYNLLKRELKLRTTSHAWNEDDEKEFTAMLSKELDKVHDFQKAKTSELAQRIRDAEKDVKKLVATDIETNNEGHGHHHHHHRRTTTAGTTATTATAASTSDVVADAEAQHEMLVHSQDAGSDDDEPDDSEDESLDALEDRFHGLEEEVANLVADVHDLALYTKLNITGFMKILKKHDKQTKYTLKTSFIQDYLEARPFYKYNWDALIVKLSKLYDLVRTRGHPVIGDSSAGGSQSAFVRQTTKYWVHPDNLVPLKLAILRHLPVLVFNSAKEFEPKDAAITSIYFDNEDLELYLGRLEKTEGAQAVRLRWYGDTNEKTIFVERKTHREDWTGEKSVKARFPIKEHLVNAFLRGEYTVDAEFKELVKKGKKTQSEVDGMIQLANEVQYAVLTRKLVPVMRTFYNRTAFQLPGDARVRISLDTELTMIREDNWDGRIRSSDNWRRTDIGIDHPFDQVAPEDKELFKYGVLEVKLQTQYGQQPPEWVTRLVQSHLVEAVPKFSKFIHGCATLLPNRVDLVPFWLPQMDTDILKPNTGYPTVERPSHISSRAGSSAIGTPEHSQSPTYAEPVSEGEDEVRDFAPAKDEYKATGLTDHEVAEAIAFRQKTLKEKERAPLAEVQEASRVPQGMDVEEGEEADNEADEHTPFLKKQKHVRPAAANGRHKPLSIDPLAPSSAFDEELRAHLHQVHARRSETEVTESTLVASTLADDEHEEDLDIEEERLLERNWKAPSGKRIAIPIRIEPKVYFAAERTFLKWMNIAIFIATIATTLLNFVDPEDTHGIISAGLFTLAALVAIAYAAIIFVYRAIKIRRRRATGMYYDPYGPTILCFVLLAALVTNIVLRVKDL